MKSNNIDARAKEVLRYLVQRYLNDGNPVGSRSLANSTALPYSPATIRNIMSDLEDIGYLISPHTSAGRIPSPSGIRFFIDQLLTFTPPNKKIIQDLRSGLRNETLAEARQSAATIISQLTKHIGFVALPAAKAPIIRQLKFIKLSSCRVLAVIITDGGDVQNRVFTYEKEVSERELNAAARAYNHHFANMTFSTAQKKLNAQMLDLREQIAGMLHSLLQQIDEDKNADSILRTAGEINLLKSHDLSGDIRNLHDLYDMLEKKEQLMQLLERGKDADNVHVFIGSESGLSGMDDFSIVFSSCGSSDGKPLGLIGVVGPTRMRYNKVIPTVDVAAKMLRGIMDDLRLPS